jgi:NAD(P)H-hydrate repair Nnr-like enzyme with NAD(P)H-hydrate dehydratase domain
MRDIPGATEVCANQYNATVVTKAAGAWIHHGNEAVAVYGAEPYLATAGSGDVLAGIIAAYACRYSPLHAASMAARLHVEAGRTLADQRGSAFASAWDIASAITPALDRLARGVE